MMNNWLQQIQSILGQKSNGEKPESGGLNDLLMPGVLGGLAGLLLTNKSSRKMVGSAGKNALVIGGGAVLGAVLWNKYKQRVKETQQQDESSNSQPTPVDQRARRLVQALVFAAKSDGHIDEQEQQAINNQIHQLGIGEQAEQWVQQAIEQPLDPQTLAYGIKNEEEALEVYLLSCAVIDIDHFMERSYLDELARALKIPDDVKQGIAQELHGNPNA
ncbi:DUF533 domain-containing protein [Budviciaceae bacterium CWB-B4]|uniref:DUF533 domain-containing protein n=1 Tax=Limnobaculum xujianqingii TaxID=2738837 RepID=A0A9D7FVD9_9GAMM|nr:DUF533 domain-containing protein [Limnobaculum xujianqingii]MBK5071431.1 DUF533 domain-containing protein [Limnobaculum xujianqingii]MBK5174740.1 DUF533 domain-containing protein [Limnobaculum xujianqingii]